MLLKVSNKSRGDSVPGRGILFTPCAWGCNPNLVQGLQTNIFRKGISVYLGNMDQGLYPVAARSRAISFCVMTGAGLDASCLVLSRCIACAVLSQLPGILMRKTCTHLAAPNLDTVAGISRGERPTVPFSLLPQTALMFSWKVTM